MNPRGIRPSIPAAMHKALRAYTFRVTTAAAAYYADEAVRNGLCATCRENPPAYSRGRTCWTCRRRNERKP